jgi:hypothetical protein
MTVLSPAKTCLLEIRVLSLSGPLVHLAFVSANLRVCVCACVCVWLSAVSQTFEAI